MPPRARQRRARGEPDATLKGPPRRKTGILYVGAAALLGVGIGLLVFILGGGLRNEAEPAAASKAAEQLRPVPAPVPAPAPAPAPEPPPLEDTVEVVVTPIEPPKPERPVQAARRP